MATKYYCDGCDKEIPHGSVRTTSVSIQVSGQVTQAVGDYELCKGLFGHHDPRQQPQELASRRQATFARARQSSVETTYA